MATQTLVEAKARVFKALGHATRLAIVEMLAHSAYCVCELVDQFGDSQATISRHLEVLLRAGIVRRRKEGVKMVYELSMPCLLKAVPCVVQALRNRADADALGHQ